MKYSFSDNHIIIEANIRHVALSPVNGALIDYLLFYNDFRKKAIYFRDFTR
ncbi:hypothetical protein Cabys_3530 [Caldithrix abyssi DSM 13497]|uniref:Uncharacterized protein n=1 Tax=Caldithrix abyssi DSM 13497 TaxID=880073 RepID=A0A1J1CD22_CALAY|nr:hypothetical protein Cabys_3530 [Caldithrix abyssi DSM 13497]